MLVQYPWSIVHEINEKSPLAAYVIDKSGEPQVLDSMALDHAEIILTVTGTAASTGNTCESRYSYTAKQLNCGHRFADALSHDPKTGKLHFDKSQFDVTLPEDPENLLLPQCF